MSDLQEEGKNAIESPTSPVPLDIGPEGYQLGNISDTVLSVLMAFYIVCDVPMCVLFVFVLVGYLA